MHRSLGRRMIIGAAAAVAAAALATPAYAAAPALDVAQPGVTVAAGHSTLVDPILYSDRETTLTGAKMVYQLSGDLDGVSLSGDRFNDCTNDGPTELTCTTPFDTHLGAYGVAGYFPAVITATEAALGETGTVKVTFSADGVAPITRPTSPSPRVWTSRPASPRASA